MNEDGKISKSYHLFLHFFVKKALLFSSACTRIKMRSGKKWWKVVSNGAKWQLSG